MARRGQCGWVKTIFVVVRVSQAGNFAQARALGEHAGCGSCKRCKPVDRAEHTPMTTSRRSRESADAKQWALTHLLLFIDVTLAAPLFERLATRGLIVID
jgi:hypothetical protein